MQKIVILVILVVILISGSVLALQFKNQFSPDPNGAQPSSILATAVEASPSVESVLQEKTIPTPSIIVRPTNKPTLTIKTQGPNLQRYVYPGSTVISQTNESLTLESSDDTMQIIAWYKQTMERENAQINNTVVNTVNGKTTATLTVSTNGENMYVTITHSDTLTTIRLEQK